MYLSNAFKFTPDGGNIKLVLSVEADEVVLQVSDSGPGIPGDQREVVFERFRQLEGHASRKHGGTGLGLSIVKEFVELHHGKIAVGNSSEGGAMFTVLIPLSAPAEAVVTPAPVEMENVASQQLVDEFDGEEVPFYWVGTLLQVSVNSAETRTKTLPVAIFRSAGQRVALHIDEVLGNQEVVVKNLGPQLSRLPGLVGMSVLASGVVVLIYNPVALATVYGEQARQFMLNAAQAAGDASMAPLAALMAAAAQAPLVLVVDDSITVRRVTQRLLKREGFRVALANDGLQALERLQEEKPAVVLSDIEMPRMDGFDLVRNIRGDAHLRDLPIVMITSRIAEKHRELARELGVNHYLGKPYSEEELIGLVRQYCAVAVEV